MPRPRSIVETVIRVNDGVKTRMISKLKELLDDSFNGKTVAVLWVSPSNPIPTICAMRPR